MRQSVTVGELNAYVKSALEGDPFLHGITLLGEVSGYKKYPSGHAYFTLKDEQAAVSCVWFSQYATGFRPENGQLVEATGSVSLYVKEGRYQFYVRSMRPAGVGALYIAFEKLKRQLEAEGLFDASRKRPIPPMPKCVGVVTSGKGAAVRDVIRIVTRRCPTADVLVCPVAVQGAQAAPDIAKGIRMMNEYGRADVLIVGRGGGSMEDLWAFNTEQVARAIAESKIPVISAVGHETDTTIADFVADLRASTPSAAAELAVPVWQDVMEVSETLLTRGGNAMRNLLDRKEEQLRTILSSRQMASPRIRIEQYAMQEKQLLLRMSNAVGMEQTQMSHQVALLTERLASLDPRSVMQRGFTMVTDREGKVIPSMKQIQSDEIVVHWQDGRRFAYLEEEHGTGKTDV